MRLPAFDPQALLLMSTINFFMMSGMMLFVWNVDRPASGLKRVAVGDGLIAAGLILAAIRTSSAAPWICLLSHLLSLAGGLLLVSGVRSFCDLRPIPRSIAFTSIVFYLAMLANWLLLRDDPAARAVFVSLFFGAIAALVAVSVARGGPREDRAIYYFVAALSGLQSVFLVARALCHIPAPLFLFTLPAAPIDGINLLLLNISVIGCGLGLAAASGRRLDRAAKLLARLDPLTQLPNRRCLEERLEEVRRRVARRGIRVALIFGDVDDLKKINDTQGHEAGDLALRAVARQLSAAGGQKVFSARIGGDEFVTIIEEISSRQTAQLFIREQESATSVRVSYGVAIYPDDVDSIDALLRQADAA
jgi:diguanylate cyclase (GGDEF)-like protein